MIFDKKIGVGDKFDLNKDFITLMHYPVTTEFGQNYKNMCKILDAVRQINLPKLIFWPNADAGSEEISSAIRHYREKKIFKKFFFYKKSGSLYLFSYFKYY